MINSSKQNSWAEDIKMRMEILLNGFKAKCNNLDDEKNKYLIQSEIDMVLIFVPLHLTSFQTMFLILHFHL